ncbi:MAG: nucleotidyltransferase domain-containing protein [Leptolyngbyaceae cyanobacterium CSU_1_4]|nr:nucleotidyltransferase domain-containing protein [Leptolyngbyaceae cyanobacterium CSU_1_4]
MLAHSPDLLEHRRQEAIAVAQQCAQILKQEFGATQTILFGSLRGDAPWHWQSDLDLAVSGISDEALWQAHQQLALVMPDWLKFDLVDLEQVSPQVRSRILQPPFMPPHSDLALKLHIDDEMAALERLIKVLNTLLDQADTIPDIALIPALASYITDFYTGCERISERVAIALEGGIPEGSNWHEQLLRQVADSGAQGRPPLWQGSLLLDLNEYRTFRHFDRHRYKLELKPDRVLELAHQVQPTYQKIQQAIAQFPLWLSRRANPAASPASDP